MCVFPQKKINVCNKKNDKFIENNTMIKGKKNSICKEPNIKYADQTG